MPIPQIVIDTNVFISAQRSRRGAASKLLSLVGTGLFEVHISVPLVLEYEDVLLRQRQELGLTPEDVGDVIDAFCALAAPHEIFFLWRPFLRDPKDELLLELAVKAQCGHIVTYNQRDFEGSEKFGIAVVTPGQLLHEIGVIP